MSAIVIHAVAARIDWPSRPVSSMIGSATAADDETITTP
jgi:hypothetical protein